MVKQSLETATTEVRKARGEVRGLRKLVLGAIAVGIVAIVVVGICIWFVYDSGQDHEREACELINDNRADLKSSFELLADELVGDNPSPEAEQRRDNFLAAMEERFPAEEC